MKTHFKQTWENEFQIFENEFQNIRSYRFLSTLACHTVLWSSDENKWVFYQSKLGTSIAWNCFMFSLNDTDRSNSWSQSLISFHLLFKIIISPPSQLHLSHCTPVCRASKSYVHGNGLAYRGPLASPDSVFTPLIN